MDGNAKHDLEHVAEKSVSTSTRVSKILSKLFAKLVSKVNKYYQKHFSSSMKALRKDGATKELYVSPPLSKAEAKQIIAAAKENNIMIGVKKMTPEGEAGRNKSLHKQEKLAKNEIKYQKWKERANTKSKIPFYNKISKWRALSFYEKSIKDEKESTEQFIVIINKSKLGFLNEQLEKIPPNRLKNLTDINKDGVVDERDCELVAKSINLTPKDLNKVGENLGTCNIRDYQKNYCVQKITKEQYCEIREQLFNLRSHGAEVINENEVEIAIHSDDLSAYREIAPLNKPIREHGAFGARDITTESNANDVIEVEVASEEEYSTFKEKYRDKDYLANHNIDGTVTVLVKETDTKQLLEENKKKSTTEELVKEATEFSEKNKDTTILENVLDKEDEELAR